MDKKSNGLDGSCAPYKTTCSSMSPILLPFPAIQQMYTNGHFCCAFKSGIVTNGMGIVRDITFCSKNFLNAHLDIMAGKESASPDEDKNLADGKTFIPLLSQCPGPSHETQRRPGASATAKPLHKAFLQRRPGANEGS